MSGAKSSLDDVLARTQQRAAQHQTTSAYQNDQVSAFLRESDDINAFEYWLSRVAYSEQNKNFSVKHWLNRQIALLDELICDQLNAIIHHPDLQKLEASWLGLWLLVDASSGNDSVKVKLLDVSWKDLSKDIERAPDFDQSAFFHLIYSEEFGTPGGEPYSVLLGDYNISHRSTGEHPFDDVFTLQGISHAAAAAFAPFICGAAPQLFGLDNYEPLGQPINLDSVFGHKEYIRWNAMRELEDSRFLAVTLPRVLMREPYNQTFSAYQGLRFKEQVTGKDSSKYLWGNPCFAMGAVLIREFSEVGWFSHIRGVPRDYHGGGLVTQFPSLPYQTDSTTATHKIVTPVLITDSSERQLSDLGFIALCHCYDTPYAAFNSCPSLQQPKIYSNKAATANARISAMLQQILCASRFAQYIKVMIRDKIGGYFGAQDCERYLQRWLEQYTTGRDDLSWEMMARYPLREARVQVMEEPGKPGSYQSIIHLKSHYSVDHLVSELKLTTALNQASFG